MAGKETVLENDFVTLWYHRGSKIVHHQFHQFIFGDKFREALTKGADIFEKEGAVKWLSDDRGNGALPQDDTDWARSVWAERVKGAGWKYWAIVVPVKLIGLSNMKKHVEFWTEQGITTQMFSDPDAALEWLQAQK